MGVADHLITVLGAWCAADLVQGLLAVFVAMVICMVGTTAETTANGPLVGVSCGMCCNVLPCTRFAVQCVA